MSGKKRRVTDAMKKAAALDDFALRSFRDIADQDYIAARTAYRFALYPQFNWSALQALEKYLKGILLLNRIPAKDVGHDLSRAMEHAKQLPFEIKMSSPTEAFVAHLDRFGRYRYLEASFHLFGPKLVELDRAVWEVRRYCQRMNYDITLADGTTRNLLALHLAGVEVDDAADRQRVRLSRGLLEAIIENKDHPARGLLVWKNLFYGGRVRRSVKLRGLFHATNSPLSLRPELVEEVVKYVHLPKVAIEAYRAEAGRQREARRR